MRIATTARPLQCFRRADSRNFVRIGCKRPQPVGPDAAACYLVCRLCGDGGLLGGVFRGGFFERGIVRVSLFCAAVEGGAVVAVERGAKLEATREIGVGDEPATEGDGVGVA